MEEGPAVLGVGTSVHFHHERVDLRRVEAGRLQQPALHDPAVGSGERVLLGLRDVALAKPWVEIGKPRLGALHHDVQLARVAGVRRGERDDAARHVEVVYAALPADLGAHVALEVDGVDARRSRAARREVHAVAVARPAHRHAVAGAHVADDSVADSQVEVGRDASRSPARRGHGPQPVEQTGFVAIQRAVRDDVTARRPDRRHDVVAGRNLLEVAAEVDRVDVRLAVQVAILVGVAGDHEACAVRRPVEAADVPRAVGQLRRLPAVGGHDEDVLMPAVAVADCRRTCNRACSRRAPPACAAPGRCSRADVGRRPRRPDRR